jgi:hypothetical protein
VVACRGRITVARVRPFVSLTVGATLGVLHCCFEHANPCLVLCTGSPGGHLCHRVMREAR